MRHKAHTDSYRFAQRLHHWLEALILKLLWFCVGFVSIERGAALGRRLMQWVGPRNEKHRHVRANLRMAFPEKPPQDIERLAVEVWGNIGAVLAEFKHLKQLMMLQGPKSRIDVVNRNPEWGRQFQKPCIYVGAHLANWELVAVAGQYASGTVDAVYNPQQNPLLEQMVQHKRNPVGCNFIGNTNVVRRLFKSLKGGQSVGMLADLRADGGKLEPFFGTEATVTTAPAWLSLKAKCPIVPIQIIRIRESQYRVVYHPAIRAESCNEETPEQTISRVTRQLNGVMETWIRENPQDWMCTIRRWPKHIMKERGAYN